MRQIVELNTDKIVKPDFEDDMITVRAKIADALEATKEAPFEATVVVLAYNRLDKTKDCIESILKYTQNVNYNLVLIDNGSEDDQIFEYFKSVDYENTYILRVTQNIEINAILSFLDYRWISKNLVFVGNDLVVTENWLKNMLAAVNSDKRIGMITPMSTNSSNLQTPDIKFTDIDDFQKKPRLSTNPIRQNGSSVCGLSLSVHCLPKDVSWRSAIRWIAGTFMISRMMTRHSGQGAPAIRRCLPETY